MTAIEPAGSNLPAVPGSGIEGLEDFNQSDMVMPTIRIDHKKGVFVDGLSNEEFSELDAVLLGLIKQRVLWEPEVEENSKGPLCRSYEFTIGRPDIQRFPWTAAPNFQYGTEALPCADCPLKEWGSHPQRDTPWCSEQHTFALLMPVNSDGDLAPALLTVQRSAIKPSKTYLTSFARSNTPLFTVRTKISLDARRRGTVDFAVPKFVRGVATDQEMWPEFAENYRMIREFVQTPRGDDAEGEDDTAVAPAAAPAAQPVAAPVAAAPAAAPVAQEAAPAAPAAAPAAAQAQAPADDDLPF